MCSQLLLEDLYRSMSIRIGMRVQRVCVRVHTCPVMEVALYCRSPLFTHHKVFEVQQRVCEEAPLEEVECVVHTA